VNGDGYADMLVGAPGYDGGFTDEGAVFVFYGAAGYSAAGTPTRIEGGQASLRFGQALASADVNGDGYSDVVAGAELYDSPDADEGVVFVFYGGASGLSDGTAAARANAVLQGDVGMGKFGHAVAGLGDTDGDGYDDIAVGAPDFES